MLSILYRIYVRKLEKEVFKRAIPRHVAVIINGINSEELFKGLERFVEWCRNSGIREITFAIDGFDDISTIKKFGEKIDGRVKLIHDKSEIQIGEGGFFSVNFLINFGGKKEIIDVVRKLAEDVSAGKIEPDELSEEVIEKNLKITSEPDVIIRASLKSFDFLIWQSIYSEHIFFDIDWKNLRYIDFLRILREYQKRERRYGR